MSQNKEVVDIVWREPRSKLSNRAKELERGDVKPMVVLFYCALCNTKLSGTAQNRYVKLENVEWMFHFFMS